jgi:hypothetical protein
MFSPARRRTMWRMTSMNSTPMFRAGAACGVAGAVTYVLSAFTAGIPLGPGASTQDVIRHLSTTRTGTLTSFALALLATALLLWFAGYLRALVASTESAGAALASITLVSWAAVLLVSIGGAVPLVAVVWYGAARTDPGIVRLAFDASNLSLYALSAPAAALSVLVPCIVIWRTAVLARWIAVLGAVEIGVNIAELAGLFARTGVAAGGWVDGAGPFLWVVWVAAVSVAMMRAPVPTPDPGRLELALRD